LTLKKKPNIYLADDIHPDGINLLKKKFNIIKLSGLNNSELIKKISSKAVLSSKTSALVIRSSRQLEKKDIKRIIGKTNIRLICTASSGFDNIDIKECRRYGIDVLNVFGGNSISAAEFTIGLILAITKGLMKASNDMSKGKFDNTKSLNTELYGKTIGIIGVGRVGSHVARLSRSFGMKILGNDINKKLVNKYKFVKFVSLSYLLQNSDVVTLHVPLDNSTRKLVNKNNIAGISKHSILINCSRGGIVDEPALINALKKNKIKYAGIDVFENEPNINKAFAKLKTVILTPHFAGKTVESRKRMASLLADKIMKYYHGNRHTLKFVN